MVALTVVLPPLALLAGGVAAHLMYRLCLGPADAQDARGEAVGTFTTRDRFPHA